MSLARIKSHLRGWREWELNPIVVKELRQAVRSWSVTGALLLFLLVLFVSSMGFLASTSSESESQQVGAPLFTIFLVILGGASLLFIPLYLAIRMMAERQHNNPDLIYVTTLTPNRIIFGKFLCGAYMAVLFFSACLPFMAFTNMLRGVDLPTIFFILLILFLLVCAINQVAIFFACLPVNRALKTLVLLICFFQSIFLAGSLSFAVMGMIHSGVGAMMIRSTFWLAVGPEAALGALVTGLFFVLSVALISPLSANRALPVRLYVTMLWVIGGLVLFGVSWHAKNMVAFMAWPVCTLVVMICSLLVVISNSDDLSLRVRRDIPPSLPKRVFAFLFFNGAAGGLVWAAILSALTFAAGELLSLSPRFTTARFPETRESWQHFMDYSSPLLLYAFAYSLTALFVQRKFFPRRPPKLAGLIAVLLVAAWSIIPNFVLFFLNRLSWNSVEGLQLGNIMNVLAIRDSSKLTIHLLFATGWLVVAVAINIRWFIRQVKTFRPLSAPPPVIG